MEDDEDMVIGNSLFQDRVIEIDYDKHILIVHRGPVRRPSGYSAHRVLYDQHRPKIRIDLKIGDGEYRDWFLFDTGRDGTMLIGEDFTGEFDVWDDFRSIFKMGTKKIVVIPEVRIGELTFDQVVTNANDPAHPNGKQSLVGNELLNQFNFVLDNHNGVLYLKPNLRKGGPYENWGDFRVKFYGVIAGAAVVLGLLVWALFELIARIRRMRRRVR